MGPADNVTRASAYRTIREAAARLKEAGVPEPAASAEILMAELLDARRGDVVTVAARAFVADEEAGTPAWVRPVATQTGQGLLILAGLAMLVFGLGRPWLKSPAPGRCSSSRRGRGLMA